MAEKHVTLAQLKRQSIRGRTDYIARIAELASLVADCFEDARHIGIVVTLPAASWSDGVQTIQNKNLLADSNYWYLVCSDVDCSMEFRNAGVKANNITTNEEITFKCEVTPEVDLTVNIIRLGIEPNAE